ncbi:hypothetical protein TNCV_336201 [Trichonephila clavipes]|nr:hypothetical protein TNCV_336201 [Trichonephila clavipes]
MGINQVKVNYLYCLIGDQDLGFEIRRSSLIQEEFRRRRTNSRHKRFSARTLTSEVELRTLSLCYYDRPPRGILLRQYLVSFPPY